MRDSESVYRNTFTTYLSLFKCSLDPSNPLHHTHLTSYHIISYHIISHHFISSYLISLYFSPLLFYSLLFSSLTSRIISSRLISFYLIYITSSHSISSQRRNQGLWSPQISDCLTCHDQSTIFRGFFDFLNAVEELVHALISVIGVHILILL